jgi:hypothetical protein
VAPSARKNGSPGSARPADTSGARAIDDFLVDLAQRFARATVADIAGSVRSFSRFLLATGRISVALADSVISPVPPRFERPRRSLPSRLGIRGFNPKLKKAAERLEDLRTPEGETIPPNTLETPQQVET